MDLIKKKIKKAKLDLKNAIRIEVMCYSDKNGKVNRNKVYVFKCSGESCVKEIRAQTSHLKTHSGFCRSCFKKGLPFQAVYNELVTTQHVTGKKAVNLTYEEFLEFTKIDKCHYCDIHIRWVPHTKVDGKEISGARSYKLDRKNNDIGYNKYNLVVCCWKCNQAKGNRYSYEEWYNMTKSYRKLKQKTDLEMTLQAHTNQLMAMEGPDFLY